MKSLKGRSAGTGRSATATADVGERVSLGDDEDLVLVGDVPPYLAAVDEVGHDAVRLVGGDLVVAGPLDGALERADRDLVRGADEGDLLEEVPVHEHLELLQDQVHSVRDELTLGLLQRRVEPTDVALLHRLGHLRELLQVVLTERGRGWQDPLVVVIRVFDDATRTQQTRTIKNKKCTQD